MNRKFFIKVSIIAIVALGLLALVQCVWVVKMYTDQIGDFQRRVESAAYKSIYKAFRMDAIPGLQVAEQINMDLDEFALHFEPNLLELDIKEPYSAEILEMTSGEGRTLMLHSSREPLGEKVHTCTIPVDDDGMFALRLTIRLPYGQFWGNMWGLLLCSALIVVLLSGILYWMVRTMFRQRSLEEMRRDFTNNITHELKTPISVAMAATDALHNYSAEADLVRRSRYLQIMGTQLEQLAAMVEKILSVSVEGREEKLNKEKFFLFPTIGSIKEDAVMGMENPPEIMIQCPEELSVTADRLHLKNVIATLVSNAVKHAFRESAPGNEVTISAFKENGRAKITVADNGMGISKEHLKHIFEKYYRVPQGNLQKARGYGLGLYYAKRVVERHGGTISARSRIGKGTEFIIELPQDDE
ncbi:MAG: hypothetical protein IJE52_08415 [Bacteroidales bacterium]|nr:hypothetical protein [Bacteroidales bacterium]